MSRFVVGLFFICGFLYAKPMESNERYNIILVHGAADSLSGVDCEASDLKAPFEYYTDSTSDFERRGVASESIYETWQLELRCNSLP
jgi:hypothetical protein